MDAPGHAARLPDLAGGLVIMSANVAAGLALDDEIIAAIRHERPHIVAFEELNEDQAHRLHDRLRDTYPEFEQIADDNEGRGILSALPLKAVERLVIADGRPDLVALVDVDGRDLYVVIGHPEPQEFSLDGLSFSFNEKEQILELGDIATDQVASVLVGDFNMTPRNRGYRYLKEMGLIDTFEERGEGSGKTFMTRLEFLRSLSMRLARVKLPAVIRFDYIFCTPNIDVESAWVGPHTGSDHLPVLARLRLPESTKG